VITNQGGIPSILVGNNLLLFIDATDQYIFPEKLIWKGHNSREDVKNLQQDVGDLIFHRN
jgi:hypothetical protein